LSISTTCPSTPPHRTGQKPFDYRVGQTADDFAIACQPCNSSRGSQPLAVFVAKKGIADTVAPVIKTWLSRAA
jgi:hypothetical protein